MLVLFTQSVRVVVTKDPLDSVLSANNELFILSFWMIHSVAKSLTSTSDSTTTS